MKFNVVFLVLTFQIISIPQARNNMRKTEHEITFETS